MPCAVRITACLLIWYLGLATASASAPEWNPVSVGAGESTFVAIDVDPALQTRVLAATTHALYESADSGRTWAAKFLVPGTAAVTDIATVTSAEGSVTLVATDQGLYGSFDQGLHWSHLFRGIGAETSHCRRIAVDPAQGGRALLATPRGLMISGDYGRHWAAVGLPIAARDVLDFAADPTNPDRLYVVTTEGIFVGDLARGEWQRRLGALSAEDPVVEEPASLEAIETDEENGSLHHLSAIAIDPRAPATVYVAGARGLKRSRDDGLTWERLTPLGLEPAGIVRMALQAHSPSILYVATQREVASFEPEHVRWTLLTQGLPATRVNDLATSHQQLWAATDQGVYRYDLAPAVFSAGEPPSPRELLANFSYEPTIAQVQEAAIRYADVHPEKIKRWRRRAALKAVLPTLDLGMDRDASRNAHVDEGSFPHFQLLETKDRDAGMDLSIKWDLGQLIWNNDQTSIDVRSKLMVQLRDDIVDEVTRTFFERRRLQVALLTHPPSDEQTMLEHELRLQELTALLDGLTGGYFSKHVNPVPRADARGLREGPFGGESPSSTP